MSIGQDLLDVPMGEMIHSMALAIAEAQWELDKSSMTVSELMSGQRLLRDLDTGRLVDADGNVLAEDDEAQSVDSRVFFGYTYVQERDLAGGLKSTTNADGDEVPVMRREPRKVSMMELGFTPTFYQFIDSIIEVKIAVKMSEATTSSRTRSTELETTGTTDFYRYQKNYSYPMGSPFSRSSRSLTRQKSKARTKESHVQAKVSSVDATYARKYSYSAEGASLLRTKMVPVPPPSILLDRIREVAEEESTYHANIINNTWNASADA